MNYRGPKPDSVFILYLVFFYLLREVLQYLFSHGRLTFPPLISQNLVERARYFFFQSDYYLAVSHTVSVPKMTGIAVALSATLYPFDLNVTSGLMQRVSFDVVNIIQYKPFNTETYACIANIEKIL